MMNLNLVWIGGQATGRKASGTLQLFTHLVYQQTSLVKQSECRVVGIMLLGKKNLFIISSNTMTKCSGA